MTPQDTPSTRPYLIRALHEWCSDNGFTPYLAVQVDASVQVPMEYVKNSEIVLNVGFEATSGLKLGNEFIEFKARFGGVARDIVVPVQITQSGANSTAIGSFLIKRLDFKIGEGEWADTTVVANDVTVKFKLALTGLGAL